MTKEIHTARCLCGTITLEARGEAEYVEYCHCKWCQQSSGSAFIPWVAFNKENVKITSGELSYISFSDGNNRGFCKKCGSTMSFQTNDNFDITLGVMDNPERFKAHKHIWTSRAIKHIKIDDRLPRFEKDD